MKKSILLIAIAMLSIAGFAQIDTVAMGAGCGASAAYATNENNRMWNSYSLPHPLSVNADPDIDLPTFLSSYPGGVFTNCTTGSKFRVFYEDYVVQQQLGYSGGFFDPALGAQRRATLCAALNYIQSILQINTTGTNYIDVHVLQSFNSLPTSNTASLIPPTDLAGVLGLGAPYFPNTWNSSGGAGVFNGVSFDHITTGSKTTNCSTCGDKYDLNIRVNFSGSLVFYNGSTPISKPILMLDDYQGTLQTCSYDLMSVLIHEIVHGLGWISNIVDAAPSTPNTIIPVKPFGSLNHFTKFDKTFLYYNSLNNNLTAPANFIQLVNTSNSINPAINTYTTPLRLDRIWMDASNTPTNQPVYSGSYSVSGPDASGTHNYTPIAVPSLLSHLNEQMGSFTFTQRISPGFSPGYVMAPFAYVGQMKRQLSLQEQRALKTLGYTVPAVSSNKPPYTTSQPTDENFFLNTFGDNIPADFTITNNGTPLTINLVTLQNLPSQNGNIKDPDSDQIQVQAGTLFNIRGCGNGGNNHACLQLINGNTAIVFTPRANFYGRAQFGFYMWDGKERGGFKVYTIDVTKGTAFANTPTGELILNGTYEEGSEVRRVGVDVNIVNTSYEFGLEGRFCQGNDFADGHPYRSRSISPYSGGELVVKNAASTPWCGWPWYIAWGGSSYPDPYNRMPAPTPTNSERYHFFTGGINYFTLADNASNCTRYKLEFDVSSFPINTPIYGNFSFNLQFYTNQAAFAVGAGVSNFSTQVNSTVNTTGGWAHVVYYFNYCGTNPSSVMNFASPSVAAFIDNVSLTVVNTPYPLSVTSTANPICSGGISNLNAAVTNSLCTTTYSWSPSTGLSNSTVANPTATPPSLPFTYTVTVNDGCRTASSTVTVSSTGACCSGGAILSGNITTTTTYSNTTILINGLLTVGNGTSAATLTLSNCNVLMGKNARINVKNLATLALSTSTRVHACGDMWDGIYVEGGGKANVISNALVEDALNAVVAMSGSSVYNLTAAIFNKNLCALKHLTTTVAPSTLRFIRNSVFTCRVLPASPVVGTYTTNPSLLTSLPIATLAPHSGSNNTTGIDIDNTAGGYINIGKSTWAPCVYDALTIGVYARNSDVYVKNSVFQRNNGTAVLAEGALNNTKTIEIGVGVGNVIQDANKFYDNTTGVYVNDYATVTVAKNNMTNTSVNPVSVTGIRVVNNKSTSVMVTGNTITNIQTGITVTRQGVNTSGTIQLNDNILTGGPGFSLGGNAILFADISTPSSQSFPVSISHNQIFTFTNGIETNGSQRYSTVIDGNTVNLKGEQFGSGISSSAINSLGSTTIINNTIDGLVTAPNSNYIGVSGISIWYTPKCTLQCNNINNTGQSMVFSNNCSSSKVANNNMNTAYDGIVLANNGVIGTQGSASSASDNQWLATSPTVVPNNFFRSQMLADGSDMRPYQFYVQNISPGYNPTKNFPINGGFLPNSLTNAPASSGCGGGGGTFAAMQSGTGTTTNLSSAALDQQISASTAQYPTFANESRIINNQMAYEYLQSYPTLIKGKYKKFADSIALAPIGLISKFNTALQQQNNTLAQSLNNSFAPVNAIEQNHQTINNYLVDYGINGKYQLATAEKNKLRAIAAQCPITGGRAVFQARALYNLINGRDTIFRDYCKDKFAGAKLSGENNNAPVILNEELGTVKIYPNPNTGQFILEYSIYENSEAVFELYDITGKQVDVLKLDSKNTLAEINENKMENGIYYYRVLVNGAIARADKLVIIK